MISEGDDLRRQHRGDLSDGERQVEALELIAETLSKIHNELSGLRKIAEGVGGTYRRPNDD